MAATLGSRILRSRKVRDEGLERAFARREASAYETAYRRFGGRLYAVALRLLRSEALAEDCVHDVMLRLWQRGSAYTVDRGALEAFLAVCVRNEALGRLRKTHRETPLGPVHEREAAGCEEGDPIESARIARAVESLTPFQRQTIDYAYFRSMTLVETAEKMQKPLGTVKSHLSAALRALRAALQTEGGANG